MTFEQYYELTLKLFRSMTTGIFLYPLFAALASSFDLNVHHYLPTDQVINLGMVFMLLSILFFPLATMLEPYFVRGCRDRERLGRKLFIAAAFSMGLSESMAIFGLVIFIVSADMRYFYLFFAMAFVHLLVNRPKKQSWQNRLDRAERK